MQCAHLIFIHSVHCRHLPKDSSWCYKNWKHFIFSGVRERQFHVAQRKVFLDHNISGWTLFRKLWYSEVEVLHDQHLILFALIYTTDFFFPLSSHYSFPPSQRGSSYGSLITAHGKYQLFAKTGYFKVRLSEFWHFQLLRTPSPPTHVHTRRESRRAGEERERESVGEFR